MKIDLHVHTTYSDGDYTPSEVVKMAKHKGLMGIAITDHDEDRGFLDLSGEERGLPVYPGIELAANYGVEVHVIGLMIDCENKALSDHIKEVALLRQQRAKRMIKKLNSAGVIISFDDVVSESMNGPLGRPHLAAALVKKGYAQNTKEAFVKYLSKHAEFYVPFDKIDAQSAAELIINAKGKPVLAHPGLLSGSVFDDLLPKLSDMGFWGIEAYHPSHTDGKCIEFECLAKRYGLYVTAGSDFHGSAKQGILIGQETRGGEYLFRSMQALGIGAVFDI